MRRAALPLGIALLIGSDAEPGTAASPCGKQHEQTYQHKAELPRGAAEAIDVAMAEKGEAYQRGDVMQKGLPLYRFMRATRSGCQIRITYEQGGFAHRWGTFSISRVKGVWRLGTGD